MTRASRLRARCALAVGALVLVACESGPSGPGELEAIVTGDMLGGVLLQVDGPGIQGFTALGDARVFGAPDAVRPGRHRVIVIAPSSGGLRFTIDVDEGQTGSRAKATTDQPRPRAELASDQNRPRKRHPRERIVVVARGARRRLMGSASIKRRH